jgi:hypothetical protein
MRRLSSFAAHLFLWTILIVPMTSHAQWLSQTAQSVAGPLRPFFGQGGGTSALNNIAVYLVTQLSTLTYIAALFMIIRQGIKLINSQEEDRLSKAKRSIAVTLVAVMLAYLTPRLVEAFYTAGGPMGIVSSPGAAMAGAMVLSEEIYGIIRWTMVLVAPLTIAMIVSSGILAIANFGSEEGVKKLRQTVVGAIGGILLLVMGQAIKLTFGVPDFGTPGAPTTVPIILRVIGVMNDLLLLLLIVTGAVIVYAGFLMVLNFGNEDQYNKAKGIIIRAAIGLAVIFSSWMLSGFVYDLVEP